MNVFLDFPLFSSFVAIVLIAAIYKVAAVALSANRTKAPKACQNCGMSMPWNANYCRHCGTKLDS